MNNTEAELKKCERSWLSVHAANEATASGNKYKVVYMLMLQHITF
jgi:hypothetical protein